MSTEPTERVAVVTGAGRGIGRGIALELARRGFSLVINYRADSASAESTRRLAEEAGSPRAITIQADLADLEQGRDLVERTRDRFGRFDVWVNNAGVAPEVRGDLLEATPESFDRVIGTNLRGPYFLTCEVARAMIDQVDREPEVPRPRIVFITSVSSVMASPARGDYCISKAGLSMAVRLFAVRLAEHRIGVFEVRPGIIGTDMTEPVRVIYDERLADGLAPIARWGTPGDVGQVVAMLADGQLGYSTGEVFHVDGGLNLPRL